MPQASIDDIYRKAALESGEDENLIKNVGDHVFAAWSAWHKNPDNLRLSIQRLGIQFLRQKKIQKELDKMFDTTFDYIDEDNNSFDNEEQYIKYQDNKTWLQSMLAMKMEYKKYLLEKDKYRKIKNEYKKLLAASLPPENPSETGDDYFKEFEGLPPG